MSAITGKRIRADLTSTSSIKNNDLLLVSAPTDKNNLFYENESIEYWNLYSQMCGELSTKYKFKSMAWEDKNSYSKINHNHNDIYAKTSFTKQQTTGTEIATFIIRTTDENRKQTTTTTKMMFPNVVVYHQDEPYIGEIKFLTSTRNLPAGDVNASNFDGWVYPTGQTITCAADEFLSACYVFSNDSAATQFTLPNLNNFFKGVGDSTTITVNPINSHEVIRKHKHSFELSFQPASLTAQMHIASATDTSVGRYAHNKSSKKTYTLSGLKLKISNLSFPENQKTDEIPTETGETHPTYNYMPVMMYIGKKK